MNENAFTSKTKEKRRTWRQGNQERNIFHYFKSSFVDVESLRILCKSYFRPHMKMRQRKTKIQISENVPRGATKLV